MCTAIPVSFSPVCRHSPVWTPARIVMSICASASRTASAHRMAWAGLANQARKPSPAVSIS
jgi:hypothetical protein